MKINALDTKSGPLRQFSQLSGSCQLIASLV